MENEICQKLNFVASNKKGQPWHVVHFLWVKCESLRLSIILWPSNSPISNGRLIALTSLILDISLRVLLELLQWKGEEEKEEEKEMEKEKRKKKQNTSLSLKKIYTILFSPPSSLIELQLVLLFIICASWQIC